MTTDLRRIPGVTPFGSRRRRMRFGRWAQGVRRRPSVLIDPRGRARPTGRHRSLYGTTRSLPVANLVITGLFLAVGAFLVHQAWAATRVHVDLQGLEDGTSLTSAAAAVLDVRIAVNVDADDLDQISATFNGEPVDEGWEVDDGRLHWTAPELAEGEHRLQLSVPRMLLPPAEFAWQFTIDDTAPSIEVPSLLDPVAIHEPVRIEGEVEPDARLWLDGERLDHDNGRFVLAYDHPPAAPLRLEAEDDAGNRSTAEVITPVEYPDRRGVHVTAAAWGHDELRAGIMTLIDEGLIDTVELDLKDEGGIIGYDSQVPLARQIGAVREQFDLAETVAYLEGRGVEVIGRLVAFRDPMLADAAWGREQRNLVVQTPDGGRFPLYGGAMINFADPQARQYNLDIAIEAVEAGVDDILYDYIRRPDGDPASMVFPGIEGSAADSVVSFLAQSHEELRRRGAYQGASVFGIAADRPDAIAQPVDHFARHTDYLAPMTYPSHWVCGEYRVDCPITKPYEITEAALADFQDKAAGTGVGFVPWLQDFDLHGVSYGPEEVRAQIRAAADLGIDSWLLWNASVRYTSDALTPLE
ncbi:hypothetical protein BH24ACT3_BH24ACT3_03090 [soil metagenome]